jgi:hypothetical protein
MPVILAGLVACTSPEIPRSSRPTVTNVTVAQDGVETDLSDAVVVVGVATSDSGECTPTTRIHLLGDYDAWQAVIELSALESGAAVLSPTAPFEERPPTLIFFDPEVETISGGAGSFTLDEGGTHELRLDAPQRCPDHRDFDPAECEPSTAVTLRFVGELLPLVGCVDGTPGPETDEAGAPYCVAGADWSTCGSSAD